MDSLSLTSTGCLVFAGYDENGEETYTVDLDKLKSTNPQLYQAYMQYVQNVIDGSVLDGSLEWHVEVDKSGNINESFS